jgi:hypothetical protein
MPIARRSLLVLPLAWAAPAAATEPFADLRWQRRLFLVFADEPGDRLDRQLALVASPKFGARDLDLIEVVGNQAVRVNGVARASPTAAELRRAFGVGEGFAVRLVGKDGGVKLATRQLVTMDDLVALVDSMPMRQQEMRARGES